MAGALPLITSAFEWVSGDALLVITLEVRIRNDSSTFNTAHLAAVVLLLRNAIGDHAPVSTDAGLAHWEGLWGLC